MKNGLVDPEQGPKKAVNEQQKKAREEPAHHLGINVPGACLPVGINAETAKHTGNGRHNQHQIGKAEVPAVHFTRCLPEFSNAGLGKNGKTRKNKSKKKGSRDCP